MMKKIIFYGISMLFLVGCNVNTVHPNEISDKEDAEKIAEQLFSSLEQNNFLEAQDLFSDRFFEVTPRDSLNSIFERVKTLGKFKHRTLADWNTFRITGSNPKAEYTLNYVTEYSLFPAQEIIKMEREDSLIKIISYHVYSDGFE